MSNQRRASAVPKGRIGKPGSAPRTRGKFDRVVRAGSSKEFDQALTDALGLPPPETAPPRTWRDMWRL